MIERFSLSFYTRGASSAIFSLPHPFRLLLLLMELKKSGSIWKKELGEPARMMDVVSEKAFATALGAPVDFVPHSPDQPNQQSHILICRQQQQQKENVVPSLPGVCRLYNVPSRGPIQWKAVYLRLCMCVYSKCGRVIYIRSAPARDFVMNSPRLYDDGELSRV